MRPRCCCACCACATGPCIVAARVVLRLVSSLFLLLFGVSQTAAHSATAVRCITKRQRLNYSVGGFGRCCWLRVAAAAQGAASAAHAGGLQACISSWWRRWRTQLVPVAALPCSTRRPGRGAWRVREASIASACGLLRAWSACFVMDAAAGRPNKPDSRPCKRQCISGIVSWQAAAA